MIKRILAPVVRAISKRANQDLLGKYTDSYDVMTFAKIDAALGT